jgi:AcrR family transcriptional regulator
MARPALTERRKAQTRREIAESALGLFARDGYDNVSVEAIAEVAGVSLRTFYRYFSAKDEVLSPIVTDGIEEFAEHIARRPAAEDLATAVQRAYEEVSPAVNPRSVQALVQLFLYVPALQARWLHDLRAIEEALVPIVRQRAQRPLPDDQAQLTAAAVVTGLRVALELSTRNASSEPLADTLGHALHYLRAGANL